MLLRNKPLIFAVLAGVAALMLVFAVPAAAQTDDNIGELESFDQGSCTAGGTLTFTIDLSVDDADSLLIEVRNRDRDTEAQALIDVDEGSFTATYTIQYPADTEPGDEIRVRVRLFDDDGNELDRRSESYTCGEPVEFDPRVTPLPADQAAPFFTIPWQGEIACSVFDVGGHGFKLAALNEHPGCAGFTASQLTVACMNSSAMWNQANVFEVSYPSAVEINFVSGQHGTCGLFPIPAAPPTLTPAPTLITP